MLNRRVLSSVTVSIVIALSACSGGDDATGGDGGSSGGGGSGTGSTSSGGNGSAGLGGTSSGGFGNGGGFGIGGSGNESGSGGSGAFQGCTGLAHEQETIGSPLDVYLIFDRTGSMGRDCDFEAGSTPPVNSKACFATYALPEYLMNVDPNADTRLAFQFMSLSNNDCNGVPYATPLVDLTPLPVTADHPIIQAISDEDFGGGLGTRIEGALRGIASYTASHVTPGRNMIGVLMTDGDPTNDCVDEIPTLSGIIEDHLAATGLKTFIIGMNGATNSNLEALAVAGGAEPHDDFCADVAAPCHYWNVGDGQGDAIASALQAIVRQVVPLPCQYEVIGLTAPPGEQLDFGKVNVVLKDSGNVETTLGQVAGEANCPTDQPAWYYDDPAAPTNIILCSNACDMVSASESGSTVNVVVGCTRTKKLE